MSAWAICYFLSQSIKLKSHKVIWVCKDSFEDICEKKEIFNKIFSTIFIFFQFANRLSDTFFFSPKNNIALFISNSHKNFSLFAQRRKHVATNRKLQNFLRVQIYWQMWEREKWSVCCGKKAEQSIKKRVDRKKKKMSFLCTKSCIWYKRKHKVCRGINHAPKRIWMLWGLKLHELQRNVQIKTRGSWT